MAPAVARGCAKSAGIQGSGNDPSSTMRDTGSTRRVSGLLEPQANAPTTPRMKNEAGLTKPTAHPRLRLWARPLRGPGGWVDDWYLWHAPHGLRARAATGLGCMQAGAGKFGVIEASYASAIIGVLSPVSSD